MSRSLRYLLGAVAVGAVVLWTLAALVAWWVIQSAAGALDGATPAAAMQAAAAWAERPWVRAWLDPHEVQALLDGVAWLTGLGGGPAAWLSTALAVLAVVLVVSWAGGIVLALLAGIVTLLIARRASAWWGRGAPLPWRREERAPVPADAH